MLFESEVETAMPFLIWVGGKKLILNEIEDRMPNSYNKYFEPFIGGGSVYFRLNPHDATLADKNLELINTYIQVRDNLEPLLEKLEALGQKYVKDSDYYFEARNAFNYELKHDDVDSAAMMIFLNRTGFNGLYRKNQAGLYNVSKGKIKTLSKILMEDELTDASIMLNRADSIIHANYLDVINKAAKGDFVYLDPPYDDTFNAYNGEGFNQEELYEACAELNNRGVKFLHSNSSTERILNLYSDFTIDLVENRHMGKYKVDEVMIKNY